MKDFAGVYNADETIGRGSCEHEQKAMTDSDTQSETDSCKSGKIRRRLPPIPQDQSPSPIPTRKGRAKSVCSMSRQPYNQPALRQMSYEEGGGHSMSYHSSGLTRPSISDTNLQQLGLDSEDMRLKELVDFQSNSLRDGGHGKGRSGSESNIYGMQFPSYMQTLKDQLKEELKVATDARRKFVDGIDDPSTNSQLSPGNAKHASGVRSPQSRHRRHPSDPKVPPFSPIKEDKITESELAASSRQYPNVPFKSYEYESLSRAKEGSLDSRDLLMSGYAGKVDEAQLQKVRETAIDSMRDHNVLESTYKSLGLRPYHTLERDQIKSRMMKRGIMDSAGLQYDPWGRDAAGASETLRKMERKSRKPRSWHPSPYVSEDEDDQMTREEKKMTIKAEISSSKNADRGKCQTSRTTPEVGQVP
ncbi:hypothetical protein GQR58_018975 [Nymphon striatum]|nr:hypothetical protein GQR58_018975 [Nymphon striatum]